MTQHEVVILSHSKDDQFLKFHENEQIIAVDSEADARFVVDFLTRQAGMIKDILAKTRTAARAAT